VVALTSLTVDELRALVPHVAAAFLDDMAEWTLHGRRRRARGYTTDKHCPLPTPEDRLWCMLIDLQQHPTPLLHGRLVGRRQFKATPWLQVLRPVLGNTLRTLGDAPCRRVETWCERRGVEGPLLPLEAPPAEEVRAITPPAVPLVVMRAPSAPSRAPKTRLHRTGVIAARTSGTC